MTRPVFLAPSLLCLPFLLPGCPRDAPTLCLGAVGCLMAQPRHGGVHGQGLARCLLVLPKRHLRTGKARLASVSKQGREKEKPKL